MVKTGLSKEKLIHFLILLVVFLAAYSYTFDSKVAMLGDNANYYELGKALAQGEGYVNISRVSKSSNNHYPPGYPAIVSIIIFFGGGILTVKLLNGAFLLFSVFIYYELVHYLTQRSALALIVGLLVITNSHILLYSSIMMSEIPFMFFSGLSLLLFTQADLSCIRLKDYNLIGSIVCLIIAYYIRSLGVALLVGYVLHLFIRQNWKALAIYTASTVGAILPWFIRGQMLGGSSYFNQLTMINPYRPNLGRADMGDFIERFFSNLDRYTVYELPSSIFPVIQPDYDIMASAGQWFGGILLIILLFIGLYNFHRFRWALIGYTLGTFGILMMWPSVWIGVRFIMPLTPILLLGFLNGLFLTLNRVSMALTAGTFNPILFLAFMLFAINPVQARHVEAKAPYTPAWQNYLDLASWVSNNLPPGVVISCGKPALFYLYANTYTMRYKFDRNPAMVIKDLEDKGVDYVVVDEVYNNTFRYLVPALRQYPDRFEQVWQLNNPNTFLLKFKRK